MSFRIAEEMQLLAEEKWILNAMNKTKNHRNCLQIEKLHLKSLKAKLNHNANKAKDYPIKKKTATPKSSSPTISTTLSSDPVPSTSTRERNQYSNFEFESPPIEASCNQEQLDLVVTKSIYNQDFEMDNMEEYDEDDADDVLIDINMLMNGKM